MCHYTQHEEDFFEFPLFGRVVKLLWMKPQFLRPDESAQGLKMSHSIILTRTLLPEFTFQCPKQPGCSLESPVVGLQGLELAPWFPIWAALM